MASANVNETRIDSSALTELTQLTGLYVANGDLFYYNGYRVMLTNKPNTEWKALFKCINSVSLYTKIENMRSKVINRDAFFIVASDYNQTSFKVAFENGELVQCYKI